MQEPQTEESHEVRTSVAVIFLLLMGHQAKDVHPDQTAPLSVLPILLCLFLYIFNCIKSFLLDLRSFSKTVAL